VLTVPFPHLLVRRSTDRLSTDRLFIVRLFTVRRITLPLPRLAGKLLCLF